MKPRVVDTCQCGRPIHEIKGMRLCPCAVRPAFCRCSPVGLVAPQDAAARLLEDVRRNW